MGRNRKRQIEELLRTKSKYSREGEMCGVQGDEQLPRNSQTRLMCPVWAAFFSLPALWIAGLRVGMYWHQAAAFFAEGDTMNKTRRRLYPQGWLFTASLCGLARTLGGQWRGRAVSTDLITRCFVSASSGSLFSLSCQPCVYHPAIPKRPTLHLTHQLWDSGFFFFFIK